MKTNARIVMLLAAWICAGLAADIGAAPGEGWARGRKPHAPHVRMPHIKAPHAPRARRSRIRSVSVKRSDGVSLHGYEDSTGTHLRGSDGKSINCQKSGIGASDINITCR